jgi:hypothetical protein
MAMGAFAEVGSLLVDDGTGGAVERDQDTRVQGGEVEGPSTAQAARPG